MCPFCKDKQCPVNELPDGRLQCACGRHAWPNSGAFLETCRRASLTVVHTVHDWTQAY